MALIAAWQAGKLYAPGTPVLPTYTGASVGSQPDNPGFESAGADWTAAGAPFISSWTFPVDANAYEGSRVAQYSYSASGDEGRLLSDTEAGVIPGQTVSAQARIKLNGPAGSVWDAHTARIILQWMDGSNNIVGTKEGNILAGFHGVWRSGVVSGEAPALATKVRIALDAKASEAGQFAQFDAINWSYVPASSTAPLVFHAVQTGSGYSGNTEPVWPSSVGVQVVDNEVTWEAAVGDGILWKAVPILKSGSTAPIWPTVQGAIILDNTISWEAITLRVEDEFAPRSAIVAIASSKVFAADDDIVAFSATVNPLDWSTAEDAGYIPFGLQTYGNMPVSAMGIYRSNLVVFNSRGFQMWQVDEDPSNMAILDAAPVGCPYHQSVQPVSNDLVFLTEVGIRNIGIAGASTNLQAGFFGKQIDPMVTALLETYGEPTVALYYAGAGQYWLIFGDEAFVLTMNGGKEDMSWSRYTFPDEITDWTVLNDALILRAGNYVWEFTEDEVEDDVHAQSYEYDYEETGVPYDGYVAWPYLDFGQLGREKQMYGFDLVMDGECDVSFGYSQSDFSLATADFTIDGDTLTGQVIPMPLTGPSFQMRLTFPGGQASPWELQAAMLYVNDVRGGT